METSCWTRAVAEGDQESCRGEKLAVLCRSVVLKSHSVHWVSGWPCSPWYYRSTVQEFSSSPRDSATMLPDTPSHVLNWVTSCGRAADTTACCILVSYQTRELNSDTVCAESSSNFIFKFSLMEMSFLPHTLSTLLYPPTHPPHAMVVLYYWPHDTIWLPSSQVFHALKLFSLLRIYVFHSPTVSCFHCPANLHTLGFYTSTMLQYTFVLLLAAGSTLAPPLPLHFYLLKHFSTPRVRMLPITLLSPLLPTWCVYRVCDILHKELFNKPTTWKGESNLI